MKKIRVIRKLTLKAETLRLLDASKRELQQVQGGGVHSATEQADELR
jgi:hypothetical protein